MTLSQICIDQENDECRPVLSGFSTDFQQQNSLPDIHYKEALLLSSTSIYISDFKKFQSQTQVQQSGKALILPVQNTLFYLSVGYLSLLVKGSQENRINDLKLMILDCDFQKYRSQAEQLFQLLDNNTDIKVLGIKIINTVLQLKSVYQLLLNYDINAFLQFIFKCILKKEYSQLQGEEDVFEKFIKYFKLKKISVNKHFYNPSLLVKKEESFELLSEQITLICKKSSDNNISIAALPITQAKYIKGIKQWHQ